MARPQGIRKNKEYPDIKANAFTYKECGTKMVKGLIHNKIEIQFCNIPEEYLPKE